MILHVFHRQHSLNLPKAVLSLSLLSFEKWPKKVSKMATILLLLLLADATTYCAKKIGYDSSKTNSNYTGFLILYFQVFVHCPILHTVNVFLVSPLEMTQRLPELNLTCMAIPANV